MVCLFLLQQMSLHGVQDKLKLIHKLNICKEMSVTYLKSEEVSGIRFHNRKNRDTLREACLPLVSAKLREIPGSNQTNLLRHNMRISVVFVLILICLNPKVAPCIPRLWMARNKREPTRYLIGWSHLVHRLMYSKVTSKVEQLQRFFFNIRL